jgi:hypothetical protein
MSYPNQYSPILVFPIFYAESSNIVLLHLYHFSLSNMNLFLSWQWGNTFILIFLYKKTYTHTYYLLSIQGFCAVGGCERKD